MSGIWIFIVLRTWLKPTNVIITCFQYIAKTSKIKKTTQTLRMMIFVLMASAKFGEGGFGSGGFGSGGCPVQLQI
jgi:uncharacterized membrane protein YgcG